jgi:AcrR family transcriptional regulator
MPKPTFFNLKEEKRQKIENSAIKEFAARGFHGARLNNIVEEAGIAKGSFYQYFEDLEDVYMHLIVTLTGQKMKAIHGEIKKHETDDVFTKFALAQKAGLTFLNSYGEDVLAILNHPRPSFVFTSDEFKSLKEKSEEAFYAPLIKEAIARGEIIDDEDLVYSVLSNTGAMIRQYLMHKTHSQNIKEIYSDEKAYNETVNLIINFIKQGLKAK